MMLNQAFGVRTLIALLVSVCLLGTSAYAAPRSATPGVQVRNLSSQPFNHAYPLVTEGVGVQSALSATDSPQQTPSAPASTVDQNGIVKIFFIGNSGTDELGDSAEALIRSAGFTVEHRRFSRSGAALNYLWHYKNSFGKASAPLLLMRNMQPDHLTIMPIYQSPYPKPEAQLTEPASEDYVAPSTNQQKVIPEPGDVKIGSLFFAAAQRDNPNTKLWLYSVWPNNQDPKYRTAATWDAWCRKRLAENEITRAGIDEVNGGKSVGIIPGGTGLSALRDRLGMSQQQFIDAHFKDGIHLSARGAYFVGLLFYAATIAQPPAERVTSNGPLTAADAAIYQQVAWDVIRGYRWAR
ncbi:hypothetical protein K9N68_04040 [Kovacikia minuta CCNUW1]|uniref:hypothetical protein n=1 Tax=Kovacikia minuta TaxID=2931930 RepID=UPI001CCFFA05|nr:hypothetical protein [Kovacikia minuta]UBF27145.1 hypothetical protein K9N68_04040 [Kovacikia minuta CCNUW1]